MVEGDAGLTLIVTSSVGTFDYGIDISDRLILYDELHANGETVYSKLFLNRK